MNRETASGFCRIALGCVRKEYPNKPGHVMNDPGEVKNPQALHPAFFGCFDWHSSVHGHWMLVRLLDLFPDLPEGEEIRSVLDDNLSADNIRAEAAYLGQDNRKSFERTYGWAWLLKLAEELLLSGEPRAGEWSRNLDPLVEVIIKRYLDFFPRQTYPIRRGVHPNSAFGLAFALDYARIAGAKELEKLVVERSLAYFGEDRDAPAAWEPDGDDFFSPSLMEADLMGRILSPREFEGWLGGYLPGLEAGEPQSLLRPVLVSDRSDPKIVHLDGLNLSRAWCMRGIASRLPEGDPRREILDRAASLHAETALDHVASGNYEGEHWLASFAVYLLSDRGERPNEN
ncbi:MAG: DUF2891 domain-containing protein [Candidatus Krumholzibacteriota bacterium]|nr:DUF2891 domain-containing protein [Candidatus Krumholzibacteriota bacterium]